MFSVTVISDSICTEWLAIQAHTAKSKATQAMLHTFRFLGYQYAPNHAPSLNWTGVFKQVYCRGGKVLSDQGPKTNPGRGPQARYQHVKLACNLYNIEMPTEISSNT